MPRPSHFLFLSHLNIEGLFSAHRGQRQVVLFVLAFTKRHKALMGAHCSSFTASCFFGPACKPIVCVKSSGGFHSAEHLWCEIVVDVWMFLMGETGADSRCRCADCSAKPVPSVPEHPDRKTELSIHLVRGQWAAGRLSGPGSDVPWSCWTPLTAYSEKNGHCRWTTYKTVKSCPCVRPFVHEDEN